MTSHQSNHNAEVIEADWTWTGHRFESGIRVRVSASGTVEESGALAVEPSARLKGKALLPGFVSAHSHAFQRGLRGRAERYPADSGNFWTWRDAMYELAETLDPNQLLRLSRHAFAEMLRAGITGVGEFHYLHHGEDSFDLDWAVLEAARQTGIRIRFLNCYYRTGGIGRPLEGAQRRFDCLSLKEFWGQIDRLAEWTDDRISLGVAAHSVRAVAIGELAELHCETKLRHLPFHIHVEEQPAEIEQCLAAYGKRPLELLLERLDVGPEVTAVHCTHSRTSDLKRFLGRRASVCICPLTEANLGDGLPDLPLLDSLRADLCLGTDSNSRISMLEEMRWLEYGQRLHRQKRGVYRGTSGNVGSQLLAAATSSGARALGMNKYGVSPGSPADFAIVDLEAPSLQGWTPDNLLDAIVFGCDSEVVEGVLVGGRQAVLPA